MANENVQKLEELLRSDEDAQAKLKAAIEAFEGDKSDEQALFEGTIGKVGEDLGLPVSFDEALAHAKSLVSLEDGELEAVAGGGSCYIIGKSDGIENGDVACAYIGLTIDL